jgi:hypothetical protein
VSDEINQENHGRSWLKLSYSVLVYVFHISQQGIYPMKEWHLENMKKTVIKYVTGLLDSATLYQRRQHKKYSGNLSMVHKSIAFDIRHGVTTMEVLDFIEKVRNDLEYANIRDKEGGMERLDLLKIHFTTPMPY